MPIERVQLSPLKNAPNGLASLNATGEVSANIQGQCSLLNFIPEGLRASVQGRTNTTNLGAYIQAAFDHAILTGKELIIPAGEYVFDPSVSAIYLNFTADDQSLRVRGAGRGVSVFKDAAGSVSRGGRYARSFYLLLGSSVKIDEISFTDLTFDKNGASNGTPPTPYGWEQAHCFNIASTDWASITPTIKCLSFVRTEVKDKVGGGYTLATQMHIGKIVIDDFVESGFSGLFGERGEIEMTAYCQDISLTDVNCRFAQTEPIEGFEAGPGRVKRYKYLNCSIDKLQISEPPSASDYAFASLCNVRCAVELSTRGISISATNCELRFNIEVWAKFAELTGCTIYCKHDAEANEVEPFYIKRMAEYKSRWSFYGCKFLPDTLEPGNVNGSAIAKETNSKSTGFDDVVYEINSCWFDPRFERVTYLYGTGSARITNSTLNCWGDGGLVIGGYAEYKSKLVLSGNDYSGMVGASKIKMRRGNNLWRFEFRDQITLDDYVISETGGVDLASCYVVRPMIISDVAPAASGRRFYAGDRVTRLTPLAGGKDGWVCVASGAPGTHKEFGAIDA